MYNFLSSNACRTLDNPHYHSLFTQYLGAKTKNTSATKKLKDIIPIEIMSFNLLSGRTDFHINRNSILFSNYSQQAMGKNNLF